MPTLEEVKDIIQEWVDKQGHDRCWYYPELFNKLVNVLDIKMTKERKLPPEAEFEEGCEEFRKSQYHDKIK